MKGHRAEVAEDGEGAYELNHHCQKLIPKKKAGLSIGALGACLSELCTTKLYFGKLLSCKAKENTTKESLATLPKKVYGRVTSDSPCPEGHEFANRLNEALGKNSKNPLFSVLGEESLHDCRACPGLTETEQPARLSALAVPLVGKQLGLIASHSIRWTLYS